MLKLTARIKRDLQIVHWHIDPADVNAVVERVAAIDEIEERDIFGVAHAVLSGKLEEV